MAEVVIRPFMFEDVEFAAVQAVREGWTTSPAWFEVWLEHDPDGCFVAEADHEPIGTVTTSSYSESAWIGNLIVRPEWRRRGIGRRLMEYALRHLESGGILTSRLDADPPGINIYRSIGFVEEFQSRRFRLSGGSSPGRTSAAPLQESDFAEVFRFDRLFFEDDRSRLLAGLFRRAEASFQLRREGRISGYAVLGRSTKGVQIGPCLADDRAAAYELLTALIRHCAGRELSVGIPGPNESGCELLRSLGFEETPPSIRMVRGVPRAFGKQQNIFAIAHGATG